jgi:hypothetical protein
MVVSGIDVDSVLIVCSVLFIAQFAVSPHTELEHDHEHQWEEAKIDVHYIYIEETIDEQCRHRYDSDVDVKGRQKSVETYRAGHLVLFAHPGTPHEEGTERTSYDKEVDDDLLYDVEGGGIDTGTTQDRIVEGITDEIEQSQGHCDRQEHPADAAEGVR